MLSVISLVEIQQAQNSDSELQNFFKNNLSALELKRIKIDQEIKTICDISTLTLRPYIPLSLRRQLFNSIHSLVTKATLKQIRRKYVWISMNKDIAKWAKECTNCQHSKVSRRNHLTSAEFPKSDRFDHVHIDLIVLPEYKGYKYCLTMIDRFSR